MFPSSAGASGSLLTQLDRDAALNRTSIDNLNANATKVTVFGIVIAKQAVRTIGGSTASTSSSGRSENRSVLNFTLRDSVRDTVNAACWGDRAEVDKVAVIFRIGDCVRVSNVQVRDRNLGSTQDQYSPDASSPFNVVLSADREPRSEVAIADEDVFLEMLPLTQIPLRDDSSVTTLADLLYCGHEMKDRHVSLLVGVQKMGSPTPISTKDGRQTQKLDVTLCDQSQHGFKLTLWDEELIHFSQVWKARETVLYVADARVRLSNVFGLAASADGKTVITVNPEMPAAMALFDYIQGVEFGADLSEDNFVDTTVYTASQLNHEIATRNQIGNMTPLTGVLYALLNQFDLDGPGARIITSRCGHCNFRLRADEPVCMNGTCPVSMGQAEPQSSEEFDIPVMWTDHTGSVERSRINGRAAEAFLGVTVDEFKNFTDDDLTALKWKFLLERFKVQFKDSTSAALLDWELREWGSPHVRSRSIQWMGVTFSQSSTNWDPVVRVVGADRAKPQEFLRDVFHALV